MSYEKQLLQEILELNDHFAKIHIATFLTASHRERILHALRDERQPCYCTSIRPDHAPISTCEDCCGSGFLFVTTKRR